MSAFLLVLWLGICVELDVDRTTILPPLPIFFPTHNSFSNTSDSDGSITLIRAETERYDIVCFSKVTTKSFASETGSWESNELVESKIASEL